MNTLLKQTLLIAATVLSAHSVFAASGDITTISTRTVTLPVDINEKTVLLSSADYGMPVVKVLVPGLAKVTIMNHQNTAAGAPCLATRETNLPGDIVAGTPAVEKVKFKIVLTKQVFEQMADKEGDPNVCGVTLIEHISATIRGKRFDHQRDTQMPQRPLSDCQ
jgi:hypothetical protein